MTTPAPQTIHDLSYTQACVLAELAALEGWDENCLNFRGLADRTGLPLEDVRQACQALRARGLARYVRSVFNLDTGHLMGSGYSATFAGTDLAHALGLRPSPKGSHGIPIRDIEDISEEDDATNA